MKPGWVADVDWRHEVTFPEGTFRWGRHREDFVAEWPDVLVVRADPQGCVRALWSNEDVPTARLEKLKRGAAAAFVRAIRGGLSWHASAIAVGRGAVLLVGDSGTGKSTLAAALCERHGGSLLSDDVAAVDTTTQAISVEPTEDVVWLADRDEGKRPRRVALATSPCPLRMCAFLAFDDSTLAPRSRRLVGTERFERLLGAIYRFIPSPEQWRRELDAIGRIADLVPLVEVNRSKATPAPIVAEYVMRLKQQVESGTLSPGESE